MSLIPMLFSDWWEGLERPHHLWDQHFGMSINPDELLYDTDPFSTEVLLYRPQKRIRRRYHPFSKSAARKGRGASTVQADKDKFEVTLDVSHFTPDEVNVKVEDQHIVVEANHAEKEDEHGWVSRRFVRKYIVPSQCDIDQVESRLSSDGILSITAPRKEPLRTESNERVIKIQYTGKPALANCEDNFNGTPESQKEQQPQQPQQPQQLQQRVQQQQQQPQQQSQHQRGRKGTLKNA